VSAPILEVDRVTMRFGGLVANEDVSFRVEPGQVYAVIGPNGAGKTTLFNAITGVYQPSAGEVRFDGAVVRKPLAARLLLRVAGTAVVSAVVAVLALNVLALWKAVVVANYAYGEPFPWGKALACVRPTLAEAGGAFTWGAAAIGAVVGGGAAFTLWLRTRRTPDVVQRAGIARTFQNIRLFGELSVLENVLVGMHARLRTNYFANMLRLPSFFRERADSRSRALELLRFVDLEPRAFDAARNLPYGLQRRLEIARALASSPRLLLLDEPAAGMNPTETVALMGLIRRIRDRGVTVLLIEHHMRVVMGVSDRICVLNFGKRIAEGTPEQIRNDPACIEAYLGKEDLG
jgi:ABC-type branched-subunit amino acid transport system ATPase component